MSKNTKKNDWDYGAKFMLLYIFGAIPLTFVLSYTGTLMQQFYLNFISGDAVYILRSSSFVFALPSFFLSFVLWLLIIARFYSKAPIGIWGGLFYGYGTQVTNSHMFHYLLVIKNKQTSIILGFLGAIVFLGGLYLSVNNYVKLTPTEIIINSLPLVETKERKYTYQDVSKIVYMIVVLNEETQKGEPRRPSYAVVMSDGYVWDTQDFAQNGYAEEELAMKYISKKSGVPITRGAKGVADRL